MKFACVLVVHPMYFDANGTGKKFKDRAILYWAQTGVDLSGDGNNHSFERFSTSASTGYYSEHHLFFFLLLTQFQSTPHYTQEIVYVL